MSELKLLSPGARAELTPAFLEGTAGVDFAKHIASYERDVPLKPLARVLKEARERFQDQGPERSDGWLAARVHATLRLTRREASDSRVWDYVALVACPEYVRWRWGMPTAIARFTGSETNQAFARLWWGAELTRNGSDYTAVETAFEAQDIPNTWFRLDAFHHRPAALAALRVISRLDEAPLANGQSAKRTKKINMLSTAFNTVLTTTSLDAIVPWRGDDALAMTEWTRTIADETLLLDQLPEGPNDEVVTEEDIAAVQRILEAIAVRAGLLPDGGTAGDVDDTEMDSSSEPSPAAA
jgi:hypothetical protein